MGLLSPSLSTQLIATRSLEGFTIALAIRSLDRYEISAINVKFSIKNGGAYLKSRM